MTPVNGVVAVAVRIFTHTNREVEYVPSAEKKPGVKRLALQGQH